MAVEKNNEVSEKVEEIVDEVSPGVEEVDVSVEGEEQVEEPTSDDFNANLAENMDERTLKRLGMELIQEYRKDKESR